MPDGTLAVIFGVELELAVVLYRAFVGGLLGFTGFPQGL